MPIRLIYFERDVLMIGTWFKDRGKLAKRLIEANIDLEIFGPNWEKDKNYNTLKKFKRPHPYPVKKNTPPQKKNPKI